jgi:hypothetical protein
MSNYIGNNGHEQAKRNHKIVVPFKAFVEHLEDAKRETE